MKGHINCLRQMNTQILIQIANVYILGKLQHMLLLQTNTNTIEFTNLHRV